jgi:transketolase
VQRIDGQDRPAIEKALRAARDETARPSIVIARTTIAYGSPNKAGSHQTHGAPLGEEEVQSTRENLGWDYPPFVIPEEVKTLFRSPAEEGARRNDEWNRLFAAYSEKSPERAALWRRTQARQLPDGWRRELPRFSSADKPLATRAASGKVINAIAGCLPELIGGSADLAPSNNTLVQGEPSVSADNFAGRNLHFGVREHAMGGALNGLALHGGIRPYGGTFLVFSDYMRPSIRLAAMMKQPVTYVFTHDSIFVGEDGPTHQPVEHAAALRAIPGLRVIHPADANETAAAWACALEHTHGPTALLLSRQALAISNETALGGGCERGGYVVEREEGAGPADIILMASGSELSAVRGAAAILREKGVRPRVVSLPCWEIFEEQPEEYRNSVLPPALKRRLAVEAACSLGWSRFAGDEGEVHALDRFGASAPWKVLAEKFGFTPEAVAAKAEALLAKTS